MGSNWGSLDERLARYVTRRDGECWPWGGTVLANGYGVIGVNKKRVYAHRFIYERERGPIPTGMEMDHLCRNPRCVNPDHLEPVTHAENMRRGNGGWHNRIKTECPYGHAYTPENTYVSQGRRNCWTCKRERRHGTHK